MKVLVGVDGSTNSLAAVEFVGRMLLPERDQITLLYVAPEVLFGGDDQLDSAVQQRARNALSRAVFDEALLRLSTEWQAKIEAVEHAGAPGAVLLEAAESRKVDMLAVGFRGTTLFERLMLGSVSRAVVHTAPMPVLVVKTVPSNDDRIERPAGTDDRKLRVLVTYDGAAFGGRIAAHLKKIEWPAATVGDVMTVVPPMSISGLPDWLQQKTRDPDVSAMADAWKKEHEQAVEAARQELASFQQSLPAAFRQQRPIVVEGRPGDQILAQLESTPYDLVVLGSRGQGSVSRLLLGSTSSQVLGSSPTSALIVR
jgi:nucleotide-binding universal stress UspA family protein